MFAPFLRKLNNRFAPNVVRLLGNFYTPFLGAGIRIVQVTPDFRFVRVEMPLRPYNRNYVGTHFGGSIYAMTDPFYMMMLMQNLGRDYIVWDKAAQIDFLKPGKCRLIAEFRFTDQEIEGIKGQISNGQKYIFDKEVLVHDENGILIARIIKTLYVRKKT